MMFSERADHADYIMARDQVKVTRECSVLLGDLKAARGEH